MHGLPEAPANGGAQVQAPGWRRRLDYFVVRQPFSAAVAVSEEMKRALVDRYGFREDRVAGHPQRRAIPGRPTVATPRGEASTSARSGGWCRSRVSICSWRSRRRCGAQAPDVRFSILGDGPLREELSRKAADLGIADCVEFVSPRPDPFAYYRSLDLYLNTSVHEGCR